MCVRAVYIGPEHVKADSGMFVCSPGPGAYAPGGISGFSSKYRNSGGCSFGTSSRPPLATGAYPSHSPCDPLVTPL